MKGTDRVILPFPLDVIADEQQTLAGRLRDVAGWRDGIVDQGRSIIGRQLIADELRYHHQFVRAPSREAKPNSPDDPISFGVDPDPRDDPPTIAEQAKERSLGQAEIIQLKPSATPPLYLPIQVHCGNDERRDVQQDAAQRLSQGNDRQPDHAGETFAFLAGASVIDR